MRFSNTATGRPIDGRWHRGRADVRRTVYSEDELSNAERVFLDVGADKLYPLTRLPNPMNDEVYTTDPDDELRNRHDIRDRPDHG